MKTVILTTYATAILTSIYIYAFEPELSEMIAPDFVTVTQVFNNCDSIQQEADRWRRNYFEAMSGIRKLHKQIIAKENQYRFAQDSISAIPAKVWIKHLKD